MRSLVLALLVLAATAGVAGARGGVGIVVAGEPTLQGPLTNALKGWLASRGYPIADAAFPPDAQTTFVNCFVIEDMACARGVFEQQGNTDHVVYARAELGADKAVTITAYWIARDKDPAVDKRACAACADAAMKTAVDELLTTLAKASGVGKGRLKLDSEPSGLTVMLDGANIGTTPLERDVATGSHRIALMQGNRTVAERNISVTVDETAEVTLAARAGTVVTGERPSRVFPIILVATGVAAVATGSILIYYGSKGGTEDPYVYRGAMPAGIGTTVAGAAMLTVGTILWLRTPRASAPVASVTTGGAYVGWAGAF